MRSHSLTRLRITGQLAVLNVFPDFDFYNIGRVTHLAVEWSADTDDTAALLLVALYVDQTDRGNTKTAEIALHFDGVRQASLPDLSPLLYLSELEIEDLSDDQLEGVRYRAKDFGPTRFEVLSNDIRIECRSVGSPVADFPERLGRQERPSRPL